MDQEQKARNLQQELEWQHIVAHTIHIVSGPITTGKLIPAPGTTLAPSTLSLAQLQLENSFLLHGTTFAFGQKFYKS